MEIAKREGGVLYKRPHDLQEVAFLQKHHMCLLMLSRTGVAPESLLQHNIEYGIHDLWPEEDLGSSQPITDEVEFRRWCVKLLYELRRHKIHHGDLTEYNVVVNGNTPYVIDFHESTMYGGGLPPKRPEGDVYWMWETANKLSPDTTRHIRRWRAIRPYLVPNTSFVDFGTAMGDFLAMADVEGIGLKVLGYENNAQENWTNRYQHPNIVNADITKLAIYECHTALFTSVYPHIVKVNGEDIAYATLSNIILNSKQAFVEFQLAGDGIGDVTGFRDDDDVLNLLAKACYGTQKYIDPIVTIPVHGREPLTRTVWRVYDDE